jgi:hypothetical protein
MHTSQISLLNGDKFIHRPVISLSVVKMSVLELPGRYQDDGAASMSILIRSVTTTHSFIQGHEISAEEMSFQ